MKSNGGCSADEVVHQPITTVLSGPRGRCARRRADRQGRRVRQGADLRRRRYVDRRLRRHRRRADADHRGQRRAFPSKIPMIDVVTVGAGGGSIAWLSPEGTLKVGPHSAGADPGPICYRKGGLEVTITDAHVVLGRIPAPARRRDPARRGRRHRRDPAAGRQARHHLPRPAPTASWRSPPGTRPTPCARSPSSAASDVRDFTSPPSAAPARCCAG